MVWIINEIIIARDMEQRVRSKNYEVLEATLTCRHLNLE